jgi:hypothetical protein
MEKQKIQVNQSSVAERFLGAFLNLAKILAGPDSFVKSREIR